MPQLETSKLTSEQRIRMCDSKVRFGSAGQARWHARKWFWRGGDPSSPYHCPVCHGWHLTTKRDRW